MEPRPTGSSECLTPSAPTVPPRVALERAVYFTESFKTTEGQPLVLRWAKALKHIAENISVDHL